MLFLISMIIEFVNDKDVLYNSTHQPPPVNIMDV